MGGTEAFDDATWESLQFVFNLMEQNRCNSADQLVQKGTPTNCLPPNLNLMSDYDSINGHGGSVGHALMEMEAMNDGLLLSTDHLDCAGSTMALSSDAEKGWSFTTDQLWSTSHVHDIIPSKVHLNSLPGISVPPETARIMDSPLTEAVESRPRDRVLSPSKVELTNITSSPLRHKESHGHGVPSHDKLLLQGYSWTDEVDDVEADDVASKSTHSQPSNTLLSERKRRSRLNQRLYTLRSLVPNISKMDKASIVGDAISYVQDLQKQLQEIQAEVSALQSMNVNHHRHPPTPPLATSPRMTNSTDDKLILQLAPHHYHDKIIRKSLTPLSSSVPCKEGSKQYRQIILQLDVSNVEANTFHLRIHCKKAPGVLLQLSRAFESLHDLDFRNSNLNTSDGRIIKTTLVKINQWKETTNAEKLKKIITDAASNYGFEMRAS